MDMQSITRQALVLGIYLEQDTLHFFICFQLLYTIKPLVLPSEGRNNVRKLSILTKKLILKLMIFHAEVENFG